MKKLFYLFVLLLAACTSRQQPPLPTATENLIEQNKNSENFDTAAIALKFSKQFNIPEDSVAVTKIVVGKEAEKYLLLSKLQSIQTKIKFWNKEIEDLKYWGEDNVLGTTWYVDIEAHADASIHINKLLLEYDEILEALIEGDFNFTGSFYQATANSSVYWIIENAEGLLVSLKRK